MDDQCPTDSLPRALAGCSLHPLLRTSLSEPSHLAAKSPLHDCQEIIAEITQVHPDLQDSALPNSELVWYTDGSSFVSDGLHKAGSAVVDQGGNIIWSGPLTPGTSAQKAKLIMLAEALERAEGKRVTVYTNNHYAFSTVHVHGAIYRERGFITAEGKELHNLLAIQTIDCGAEAPSCCGSTCSWSPICPDSGSLRGPAC
jgi:ribonuclease HI